MDFNLKPRSLKQFHGPDLMEQIDSGELIFVIFWSNTNIVSSHAFELWSRLSVRTKDLAEVKKPFVLGSVACHEEKDVCTAFGIDSKHPNSIFAYKNTNLFASLIYIGDEEYYLNWIKMFLI